MGRVAPHLEFLDLGGDGYAKVRLSADEMRTEVCLNPAPITRSEKPDGGPLTYRTSGRNDARLDLPWRLNHVLVHTLAKRLLNWVEAWKIRSLVVIAFASIFCFATVYYIATAYHSGLAAHEPIRFGDCIYFSVVTFTSLGYGDVTPIGFGRIVACVEVAFGLGLFGIGVAKLSSYKQSYLLNQLYARELQQRLDIFAESLQEQRRRCADFARNARVPAAPSEGAMRLLNDVRTDVMKMRAVISFESRNGYLISGIPIGSITGLLQALSRLLPALVTIAAARRTRRSQRHRLAVQQILIRIKEISTHFAPSTNESISAEVKSLQEKCDQYSGHLGAVNQEVDIELKKKDDEQRRRLGISPRTTADSSNADNTGS